MQSIKSYIPESVTQPFHSKIDKGRAWAKYPCAKSTVSFSVFSVCLTLVVATPIAVARLRALVATVPSDAEAYSKAANRAKVDGAVSLNLPITTCASVTLTLFTWVLLVTAVIMLRVRTCATNKSGFPLEQSSKQEELRPASLHFLNHSPLCVSAYFISYAQWHLTTSGPSSSVIKKQCV